MQDETEPPKLDVGNRLLTLRLGLGLSQRAVAKRLGYTQSNKVSQWEGGVNLPSLGAATALRREFGITLDWLYLGDRSGLTTRLIDAIDAGERGESVLGRRPPFRGRK